MHGENSRRNFEHAERELIRQKLFQYMRIHHIGVPALAERIQAAHPRGTEIPISTLQRFLDGRTRTNEDAVRLCYGFAEGLTASDSTAALGEALSIFYTTERDTANPDRYSGRYYCDTEDYGIGTVAAQAPVEPQFDIAADAGFWRVIWRITERSAFSSGSNVLEGVLACAGDAANVLLKDRLTGLPTTYILSREPEALRGYGVSVPFLPGQATGDLSPEPVKIRLSKKPMPPPEAKRPTPAVRALIRKFPADDLEKALLLRESEVVDRDQISLLQGSYSGKLTMVTGLLARGVSPNAVDSCTGMTALHLAIGRNHLEIVHFSG